MKYLFSLLSVLSAILLTSCTRSAEQEMRIMVTIDPLRYFAEQLVDSIFVVETLVPPGVSPETYDPVPTRMIKLENCKAYFAVGHLGFEQAWLAAMKENFPAVRFYSADENTRSIVSYTDHGDHRHEGVDPHMWSSPREAIVMVRNMCRALQEIDPANSHRYAENLKKLEEKIGETESQVRELLEKSSQKAFIIYHPALTYFARDYGLTQYCMEVDGKEPTPAQMKELVETARERGIKTIFIQREFDRRSSETLARETGCRLLTIDPLSYDWHGEILKIAKTLSDE